MLKKKICKRCTGRFTKWDKRDEEIWEGMKIVYCYHSFKTGNKSIIGLTATDEEPPEWCPYELEHVVLK